jgi:Ca2+-binding EF-hand superfamily protein
VLQDSSGLLSSLECEAGLIDLGFSLVEVAELFSRSDRNTDGSLSLEEFRAGVMQCVAVV